MSYYISGLKIRDSDPVLTTTFIQRFEVIFQIKSRRINTRHNASFGILTIAYITLKLTH
jgi:hypothetical protein